MPNEIEFEQYSVQGLGRHLASVLHDLLVLDDVRPVRAREALREGDQEAEGSTGQAAGEYFKL